MNEESQITNPKLQTNSKFQCSKSKTNLFCSFGIWLLDIVWDLMLGIWDLIKCMVSVVKFDNTHLDYKEE
ncbi:MAG: hypothetical protein ACE5WD_02805 [Candidatus Aminicenantia bacterium]